MTDTPLTRENLRKLPGFVRKRVQRALVARWLAWRFRRRPDHPALDPARAAAALRDADSVLFLCWGNVCRSPLAARLLSERLDDAGVDGVTVRSAGLGSVDGRPSPSEAVTAARDYDVDLADHRSRLADAALVRASDVLLVMDYNNYHSVARSYPEAIDRTFFLGVFAPGGHVIPDPHGESVDRFRDVYAGISAALTAVADAFDSERTTTSDD